MLLKSLQLYRQHRLGCNERICGDRKVVSSLDLPRGTTIFQQNVGYSDSNNQTARRYKQGKSAELARRELVYDDRVPRSTLLMDMGKGSMAT